MRSTCLSMTPSALTLGLITAICLAAPAPAPAATIDFSTFPWESTGNVYGFSAGAVTLSTDNPATEALVTPDLQTFLGLGANALDSSPIDQAYEGSALKQLVASGDQLSFTWTSFLDNGDTLFVVLPGTGKEPLTSAGSQTFTFTAAGLFGMGVADIGDYLGTSTLSVTNASFTPAVTPVPTPALLPSLAALGLRILSRRRTWAQGDPVEE